MTDFLNNLLGFQKVDDLGHYIGIPLFHKKVTNSTIHFVIEKVRMKLQSWDARQSSFAGRATLAQSVLLAIPSYFMQSMMIPRKICDEIECLVRRFIWRTSDGKKKTLLVGWDSICQPKWCGGLGMRQFLDQNIVFLLKLGYKLVSDDEALWVRVLRSKYRVNDPFPVSIAKAKSFFLWKSLSKVWNLLHDNLLWSVGDALSHEELSSKDWIFLNTDGVVQKISGRAVVEGAVRDGTSNWVMGYNRFLGNCLIFNAELWGILDGLKLIQRRGHSNVIIHSNSLEVVKAIHDNVSKSSTFALIRRIHRILSQESHWILRYIPREENHSADDIAKLAFGRDEDLDLFESPPDEVLDFLKSDKERIFVPLEYPM
ncbi:hypothetical protein PVK06_034470 [Gossypium arboreum]|uniref:RNase H type-1 domain-containing protein n=1 Tax=Gossypium arboreum TaxID=29729 RepID=A0ABR0NEB9_GOSAR|nr:hypothetical protein PVK06_034470 [Gossypium arboreum]